MYSKLYRVRYIVPYTIVQCLVYCCYWRNWKER